MLCVHVLVLISIDSHRMWDVKLSLFPAGQSGQSESPFQHTPNIDGVSTPELDFRVGETLVCDDVISLDDVTTNGVAQDPEEDTKT